MAPCYCISAEFWSFFWIC